MNKTLAKILLVFMILGLTSCSYSPIFSEKNYNFEINEIVLTGDKDINKILREKFNRIRNNQNLKKKEYKLLINSEKERNIVLNIYNVFFFNAEHLYKEAYGQQNIKSKQENPTIQKPTIQKPTS